MTKTQRIWAMLTLALISELVKKWKVREASRWVWEVSKGLVLFIVCFYVFGMLVGGIAWLLFWPV